MRLNDERHRGVAENRRRILVLLAKKGSVKNDDIEALLGVSDATATRYMRELAQLGKVVKQGDRGRGVYYERAEKEW